ncbi:hypothetical protein NP493_182g00003 [Ridgeia piscesae]|uniref:Uncharacterized protein n=1 Tax=Ridgeia piscesae TaxID=27915 RepID=A0AAD9P2U2_RIDPI|nr:hypothetical protein NP493_182g00003 [Ridgeia piscesae]
MYSGTNMLTFNHTKWNVSNVSMSDVFLKFAHRKKDMIASCRWKGRPCSHDDFQLTVTDAGVCYTFNSRISPNSSVDASGIKHGLQLVLNVEQYEYMRGPHNAVGLKFLLHRQDDVPLVQDFGENIPAGMNTFVAVTVTNETNLPPPHGDCVKERKLRYFDRYSQAACYRECRTDFVVHACGCRDYYMPSSSTG